MAVAFRLAVVEAFLRYQRRWRLLLAVADALHLRAQVNRAFGEIPRGAECETFRYLVWRGNRVATRVWKPFVAAVRNFAISLRSVVFSPLSP